MNERNSIQWKPDFEKNWSKIDLDSYRFIIQQAEKNFDEIISESESITNKSIKILTFNSILFSFYFSYLTKLNNYSLNGIELVIPLILFLVIVFIVLKLMFPKCIRLKGFSPKDLLSNASNLDSIEDENFQLHILYYITIVKLENNIFFMKTMNTFRAKFYKKSIIVSVFQLILMMIIFIILNHPLWMCHLLMALQL